MSRLSSIVLVHIPPSAHGRINTYFQKVTLLKKEPVHLFTSPPPHTASQVSTTAASTKAEDTVPPSGMTEGRSENVSLLNRRKGSDGLELELHVTTSTPPPDSSGSPRRAQVYPMSADILSDRDSRSISEERYKYIMKAVVL